MRSILILVSSDIFFLRHSLCSRARGGVALQTMSARLVLTRTLIGVKLDNLQKEVLTQNAFQCVM